LTCSRRPAGQWTCARSTNAIERLNEEFRRRVNTQGALPTAQTAELLFSGLLLTGHIRMRRIDGGGRCKQSRRPWRRPWPPEGGYWGAGRQPIAPSTPPAKVIVYVTCGEQPISTGIEPQPSSGRSPVSLCDFLSVITRFYPSDSVHLLELRRGICYSSRAFAM
ncbi:MAG: hypothetical protein C4293_01085, partial [Nitrospiraceae bacterium]